MLGYFATKKPDVVNYELNEKGLKINTQLYPYKNIKSFWIHEENQDVLFIKIERFYMPIISMPVEVHKAEEIKDLLLQKNIPEEQAPAEERSIADIEATKEKPKEEVAEGKGGEKDLSHRFRRCVFGGRVGIMREHTKRVRNYELRKPADWRVFGLDLLFIIT